MKPIYLVGFMGCGKTTVGNILSEQLNIQFIDIDEEIILHTSKTIPTIFEEYGENGFRDIESEVLKKVTSNDAVISTGGGIITREENINFMKKNGILFYLETSVEILYERICFDHNRPNAMNRSLDDVQALFASRKSAYEKADFSILSNTLSPLEVALEIINCLNSIKGGDSRNKN